MIGLSQYAYINKVLVRLAILCTRLDICHAMGLVSKYQSNPGPDHWTTVKCILKYLRRTRDYMLIYGSDELIPVGYTDSDFMSDKDSRKSTSGYVFMLGGGAIKWRSIKQECTADSTLEAEYVAACEVTKEAVWFKRFLMELGVVLLAGQPLTVYCDNNRVVNKSKEPRSQKHVQRQ